LAPFRLLLPRELHDAMLAQALAERPNECCGILAGTWEPAAAGQPRRAIARRRYPLGNEAASPSEYLAAPSDLCHAFRDLHAQGLEHLAIYHSHPTTEPVPSRTDLERNYYGPEVMFLIISLKGESPTLRAWWLDENSYREAEWELIESQP
jgi:proteasome lid subunit RPN8/RPN11